MPTINDTPNTPGTIGYDDRKPATYSGSNPGVPADQAARPDWAGGRQEYAIIDDVSTYRLSVHAGGETFTAVSEPSRRHTMDRETAAELLRKVADQMERT